MTPEELQALLTGIQQGEAQKEAQLAADLQAAEEAAIINAAPLENQLNALNEQQRAGRAALLANRLDSAEAVLSSGNGFGGLATTLDAIDGTNISKAAEALANQELQIQRGGGPAGDIQRQQLGFNRQDQQDLQAELQEQQTKQLREEAKLQKELAQTQKAQQDLQIQEFKFANTLRKEQDKADRDARKEARADARFQAQQANQDRNFNLRQSRSVSSSTGASSSSFDPSSERSFIGRAQGFAVERNKRLGLKSSSNSIRKDTQGVVDNLVKVKDKAEGNTQRARSALKLLEDPKVAATNIAQIQTLILKASGEVGGLTSEERNSVSGVNKSFFERAKAAVRREGTGTLSPEQLTELRRVANIFLQDGQRNLRDAAVSAKNQFLDLGLSIEDIQGGEGVQGLPSLSGVDSEFFGFAPATTQAAAAPAAPAATNGFDVNAFLQSQGITDAN